MLGRPQQAFACSIAWRGSHIRATLGTRRPHSPPFSASRCFTNAAKQDFIPSLLSVARGEEKLGGWHPTMVHSSGDLKFTVIRLQPGHGEVPKHLHNEVWDYLLPLSGKAVIETKSNDGVEKDYDMTPGSFLAVPPEDVHRVRNVSNTEEFVFFIVQAPRKKYDFVPA